MSLVVDPHMARDEVKTPIVAWQGEDHVGTETWEGKLTKKSTAPQVELRRMLDDGGTAIVRLNLGNAAITKQGKVYQAGIIMSSNKSVKLTWQEYFGLQSAIDEGIVRLKAEHENILAALAKKFGPKTSGDEAVQTEEVTAEAQA